MHEHFWNEAQKKLRDEVRDFVKWVPKELLVAMDEDRVQYPREFLVEAGK